MTPTTKVLEHVGFCGVYLSNPDFTVEFIGESGCLGSFGFYCATLPELEDFIHFRASELLRCGRFSRELSQLRAIVRSDESAWDFAYDENIFRFKTHEIDTGTTTTTTVEPPVVLRDT